jgi:hypothetical protein
MLLGQGVIPAGEYTEASAEKSVPLLLCIPQTPQIYLVMYLSPQNKRLETNHLNHSTVSKVLSLSEKCYMCLGVWYVLRHDICAWMCCICLDVLHVFYVLVRATHAWMCYMCLDLLYVLYVLHVLGCAVYATCAWMCCMCLDVMCLDMLYMLVCVTCAWMCYICCMCLYVLHMLGCAVCATCAWMCCMSLDVLHVLGCISTLRLQIEALPECSSSRPHQFLLLNFFYF